MIKRTASGKWRVDTKTPAGERVRKVVDTKVDAKALELVIQTQGQAPGVPANLEETSFDRIAADAFNKRWAGRPSERTYQINVKAAVEFFGRRDVGDIDTNDIDGYIVHLRERGNTGATINRKLSVVHTILLHAKRRKLLQVVPYTPRLAESKGRLRWLTRREEEDILNRTAGIIRSWIAFQIDTGLRPGETAALKWGDLVEKQGRWYVHVRKSKNGTERTIPLTSRAFREANRWGLHEIGPFTTVKDSDIRYCWNALRRDLNLQDDKEFVPYCMRHTCATRLLEAGVSLPAIKTWMGHLSISTTLRYAHLQPDALDAAVDAIQDQRDSWRGQGQD